MSRLSRHSRLCIRKAAFCTAFYSIGGAFLLNHNSWKAFIGSLLLLVLIALPWLSVVYILGGRLSSKFSRYEFRKPSDQEISESLALQFIHLGRIMVVLVLGFVSITLGRLVFALPIFVVYAVTRLSPR